MHVKVLQVKIDGVYVPPRVEKDNCCVWSMMEELLR
jgi:hypothetical protein